MKKTLGTALASAALMTAAAAPAQERIDLGQDAPVAAPDAAELYFRKQAQEAARAPKSPAERQREAREAAQRELARFETNPLEYDTSDKIENAKNTIAHKMKMAKARLTQEEEIRIEMAAARAAVLHDPQNRQDYVALHNLPSQGAKREGAGTLTYNFGQAQDIARRGRAVEAKIAAAATATRQDYLRRKLLRETRLVFKTMPDGSTRSYRVPRTEAEIRAYDEKQAQQQKQKRQKREKTPAPR